MPLVRVEMIKGKSHEYTDIFIVINEPANENWGLGGKQKE